MGMTAKLSWLANHRTTRERPLKVLSGVLRWEYHRRAQTPATLNLDGMRIVARPFDGNGRLICYFGDQFDEIFDFMRRYLKPGMTYVDVGANIGSHVLNAARLVGKQGHVYAFEADPKTFDLLQENIANNRATVDAANVAVTASEGVLTLYLNQDSAKNSLVRGGNGNTVSIPGKPLSDLLPQGAKIDILKIDVEGADLDVLRGAEVIFANAAPDIVIIEVFDVTTKNDNSSGVLGFLLERGYESYSFTAGNLSKLSVGLQVMNAFAIHKSASTKVMRSISARHMD